MTKQHLQIADDQCESREAMWGHGGIVDQITTERLRQIELGYDHSHDDAHGVVGLVGWAQACASTAAQSAVEREAPAAQRDLLVKAAALLISAIETYDRAEKKDG